MTAVNKAKSTPDSVPFSSSITVVTAAKDASNTIANGKAKSAEPTMVFTDVAISISHFRLPRPAVILRKQVGNGKLRDMAKAELQ